MIHPRIHRAAFTLIELLIVVSLVGIMATVVTVQMQSVTETGRLRAASLQIEQALRRAQTTARTRHRPVWLELEVGGKRLRLSEGAEQDGVWTTLAGVTIVAAEFESEVGDETPNETKLVVRVTPSGAYLPWRIVLSSGSQQRGFTTDGLSTVLTPLDGDALTTRER